MVQLNSLKNHAVPAKAVLIKARVTAVIVSILSMGEARELVMQQLDSIVDDLDLERGPEI